MSTSPTTYLKFLCIFIIYVTYVLFRRLPIVFLPQIRKEISLNNDDIGFIVSIHALALTLSKLVFGVASDKTSSLKLFLGGCVVCAASSLCLAFSSSINQICGVMLMIGCVQGAGWVPATKLISSWFDKNSYATMFSILGCGSTLAGLLLPILKQYYWRTTEFNSGWMMVFFILICHFLIRENGKKEETSKKKTSEWKQLMKSSIIWNISLLYFFSMEIRTICETWIPLYLNDYKPSISNRFQFLYELGGIIGTMSSGLIIDKISLIYGVDQSRKRSGIVFSIMMMIFAISIIKFKEYASFLGFITGFFVNGSINIWCLIGSQAGNSEIAGTCSAFINFIATSGSIFAGSPLARLIANFGYQILEKLFLTQILIIVGLASFKIPLRLMKDEKKD